MTYGVDTPVHPMEPPLLHPPPNRVRAGAQSHELSAVYHSVLAPRQLRNPPIQGDLSNLTVHYAAKWERSPGSPLRAARVGV